MNTQPQEQEELEVDCTIITNIIIMYSVYIGLCSRMCYTGQIILVNLKRLLVVTKINTELLN